MSTPIHYIDDGMNSEKKWNELGRKLRKNAIGVEMWQNAYCKTTSIYYNIDDTLPFTEQELTRYKKKIAEDRRKQRAEAKYKASIETLEYKIDFLNDIANSDKERLKNIKAFVTTSGMIDFNNTFFVEIATDVNSKGKSYSFPQELKITGIAIENLINGNVLTTTDIEGNREKIQFYLEEEEECQKTLIFYNELFHSKVLMANGFNISKLTTKICLMETVDDIIHRISLNNLCGMLNYPEPGDADNFLARAEAMRFVYPYMLGMAKGQIYSLEDELQQTNIEIDTLKSQLKLIKKNHSKNSKL